MQQEAPLFSIQAEHKITRIQPEETGQFLGLEMLDSSGNICLGLYDVEQGKFTQSDLLPVYYKLAGQFKSNFLVQSFSQLDEPDKPDLIILNKQFRQEISLLKTVLIQHCKEWIYLRQYTENNEVTYFWLNMETGQRQQQREGQASDQMQLPSVYPEGSGYFSTVAKFLEQHKVPEIRFKAEYLSVFGKILISYYTEVGKKYVWHFSCFNKQGKLLMKNRAEKAESPSGTTTFMVWNSTLLLLPNQSTLVGYDLIAEGI